MDLLLLFAGRSYSRIDSFPFRLRLHASALSLLAEIVLLYLVKDQLFPFWVLSVCTSQISTPSFFGVWPSVLLKYQLLPFWGLAVCTSQISTPSFFGVWPSVLLKYQLLPFWGLAICTSQISTPSFFGVWPSVLLKYQLLPFWGLAVCTSQISTPSFLTKIARWSSVPLRHNRMFHLPLPWAGMHSAKRGRNIFGHHTYWALCVVLEKRWKAVTPVTGPQRMCLVLGPGWSRPFLFYWAGMYPAIHQH